MIATGCLLLVTRYSILVTWYSLAVIQHSPNFFPLLPLCLSLLPSDIVFLDLSVESSASNFELPGRFPQIPVCLLQHFSDQSFFCKRKRVGREVKDKALSRGKVS